MSPCHECHAATAKDLSLRTRPGVRSRPRGATDWVECSFAHWSSNVKERLYVFVPEVRDLDGAGRADGACALPSAPQRSNEVMTMSHHRAHACRAFAVCRFEESVVMVVDEVDKSAARARARVRTNKRKPERANAPGPTCLSPLACAGRTASSRPTSAGGRNDVAVRRRRPYAETALDPTNLHSRLLPEWSMWSAPGSRCRRLLPPGSRRCRSHRSPPPQRPPSHGSRPFSSLQECFPS